MRVGESKTDAGRREVTLRPAPRQVLVDLKAQTRPSLLSHSASPRLLSWPRWGTQTRARAADLRAGDAA